jgi:IS5 family transposase
MIVDRYTPVNLFDGVPERLRRTDPVLATLDPLLDDDDLFHRVKADLCRRSPHSATRGRHSTPVEVILRLLVVRRLYNWSYEDTETLVWDSLCLRQFCRVYDQTVPDDTTLIRWAGCIGAQTLDQLHARVTQLACQRTVTRGRTLRMDGTVVETTIHYPSDSSLLVDGVRVLSRLLTRARAALSLTKPAWIRNRTRSARRLARQIGEAARQGKEVRQQLYRRLLAVTRATLRQARAATALLAKPDQLQAMTALVERVVTQTQRRVLQGETVPASDKVVSLFEPHTAILRRGKPQKETEYGHRVVLGEAEGGILTTYQILPGTEPEASCLLEGVRRHQQRTGRVPTLVATDRGFHAPGQAEALQELGVKRIVIPVQGKHPPPQERTRWFRRGRRFRAGIEGRISVLKRRGWLGRCRDHGKDGFDRWIGWGIIANNLVAIAQHEANKARKQAP